MEKSAQVRKVRTWLANATKPLSATAPVRRTTGVRHGQPDLADVACRLTTSTATLPADVAGPTAKSVGSTAILLPIPWAKRLSAVVSEN